MIDVDMQDVKSVGVMLGAGIGGILCLLGILGCVQSVASLIMTPPDKLPNYAALVPAIGMIVVGPPLCVGCVWYFNHDRQQVENEVLRAPMIIFGAFHFGIRKFKGIGRAICEERTEFDG